MTRCFVWLVRVILTLQHANFYSFCKDSTRDYTILATQIHLAQTSSSRIVLGAWNLRLVSRKLSVSVLTSSWSGHSCKISHRRLRDLKWLREMNLKHFHSWARHFYRTKLCGKSRSLECSSHTTRSIWNWCCKVDANLKLKRFIRVASCLRRIYLRVWFKE